MPARPQRAAGSGVPKGASLQSTSRVSVPGSWGAAGQQNGAPGLTTGPVPVRVSVRGARAQPADGLRRPNGSGALRAGGGPALPAGDRFSRQEKKKQKQSLGEESCLIFKQPDPRPSRSCCLRRVSRKENPNYSGYSSLISVSVEGTAFVGILVRAAGARRGGGTVPRVPRRRPRCCRALSARRSQPRTGSALRSGNIAPGPRRGLSAQFRKGNPVRLGNGEAPVCSVSRVASLSGVARPGLSPALPASLAASPHRGRAVAGAVLPSCAERESPFPAAAAGAWARRREPLPLLIPLLLPLPRRAAAGPGRERLRWLPLLSPCPGLPGCCPAPGAAAGGARAQPGAPVDRAAPRGRDPRQGSALLRSLLVPATRIPLAAAFLWVPISPQLSS